MPDDPVVPLDPDRLDAIEAAAKIGYVEPPTVLALVAAARENLALRAEVERLRASPEGVVTAHDQRLINRAKLWLDTEMRPGSDPVVQRDLLGVAVIDLLGVIDRLTPDSEGGHAVECALECKLYPCPYHPDAHPCTCGLDAALAALASPEGVVTLDGQRFTVVRPSRHSTRCYLVPYRPEDTKGAGYE